MTTTEPRGHLVIIGGAVDLEGERKILRKFVELAKSGEAQIVILTAASGEPKETGEEYTKVFQELGVNDIKVVDTAEREDANQAEALDAVNNATGVFFTGGKQERISKLIKNTELEATLHRRYQETEFVIAGTSAGAHIMSELMIAEGVAETNPRYKSNTLEPGLGFLPGILIDSHFDQRGRLGRLLSALAHEPHVLGLGLDENTAVIVKDHQFTVIGENAVTIVDVSETSHSNLDKLRQCQGLALWQVKLDILPDGYGFDLENQKPILETNPRNVELVNA